MEKSLLKISPINHNMPIRIDPYILKIVGQTISKYDLIQPDDNILVGMSGGKDSWSLLVILLHFQKVSPVNFSLLPVTIDPGFNGFDTHTIQKHLESMNLKYIIHKTGIANTIRQHNSKGKNPCAFCARLRRGALYRIATEHNCNKIALGHHADDAIETMFLSAFFEGRLTSIPPQLEVTGKPIKVIRPLIRTWESDLIDLFKELRVESVDCPLANTTTQRENIKNYLEFLGGKHPVLKKNLLASLQNIRPNHFLDIQWL